jgi:hypothetical protein
VNSSLTKEGTGFGGRQGSEIESIITEDTSEGQVVGGRKEPRAAFERDKAPLGGLVWEGLGIYEWI